MGLVVRVLYNNQIWRGRCKQPGSDSLCWQCFVEGNLQIERPSRGDGDCSGHCWEQHLCVDYRWGCTPKGRVFGSRAYQGQKVFFVFRQSDGKYTLWGNTTVASIDEKPLVEGREWEKGYAFIHFNPFQPWPREKWVANQTDVNLVGEKWLMGRYRFIDAAHETYLERLMDGLLPEKLPRSGIATDHASESDLILSLAPVIRQKLDTISNEEGRAVEDIVKEAIAEWLRMRK